MHALLKHSGFQLVEHDVTIPYEATSTIDEIYNLACPASPIHYQYDPIKTIKTSILGAINMLDLAQEQGARILQASTSEVYGDPLVHPQPESYWGNVNTVGLRSCYDEGKRASETLFMDYYRERKLKTKIIRIFNTYGPNMAINDGRVVSNFIIQALKGENITVLQVRSTWVIPMSLRCLNWRSMSSASRNPVRRLFSGLCRPTIPNCENRIFRLPGRNSTTGHPLSLWMKD